MIIRSETSPAPPSWLSNGLLALAQILAWGGSFFLMALLADPVSKDTGWSRQYVYGSLSVGILVSGLLAPRVGKLIARQAGKAVLLYSGFALGLGLLVVAFAPVLPVFMLGWAIIGVGMAMGLYDALFSVLGRLYGSQAKQTITHITLMSGFCTAIIWPLLAWMMEHLGWRQACLSYGVFLWLSIWPLYKWALPGKQLAGAAGPAQPAAASLENEAPVSPVLFWLVVVNFTIAAITLTAVSVHLFDVLQAKGLSLAAAVSMGALIGPCQVGVRFLEVIGPKKHPIWSAFISATLVLAGLIVLELDVAFAFAGVVLYSLGNGIRSVLRGTLPLELFGPTSYPVVMGKLARPALIAQAITPLIGGYVVQHYGAMALLALLAALALLNIGITVAIKYSMPRPMAVTP